VVVGAGLGCAVAARVVTIAEDVVVVGAGVVDCGLGCVVCGPVLGGGCTGVVVVVEIRKQAK